MMKALHISPAFAILLVACATKPTPVSFLKENPLLWRATRSGEQVILLGTIHVPFREKDVPAHVRTELTNSKVFISEIDSVSPFLNQDDSGTRYYPTPQHTLRDDLSPKAFEMVNSALNNKYSISEIEVMKPEYACSIYRENKEEPSSSTRIDVGASFTQEELEVDLFDTVIQKLAITNGKETVPLESSANALLRHCNHLDAVAELESEAVSSGLNNSSVTAEKASSDRNRCLLEERNLAWLPIIEAHTARSQRVFVAVGVAHLVLSKPSLLDLLEQRGFKIERIDP